jgi:hypothetical protein
MTRDLPAGAAIGVLHPGEMGAAVGALLAARGREVRWVSAGRSEASRRRAAEAGLHESPTLDDLVARASVILSICPPAAAVTVATEVAHVGFEGVYVDANAIAPSTAAQIDAHHRPPTTRRCVNDPLPLRSRRARRLRVIERLRKPSGPFPRADEHHGGVGAEDVLCGVDQGNAGAPARHPERGVNL